MIPAPLAGLRVGAVSYLNTKPLIWGIDPAAFVLAVPSRLAAEFYGGHMDVALMPVFAMLKSGGGLLVDDVAIACRGAVYSVFVASRTPLEDCREIYLDPSSRSSAALLRTLIAEFYGNRIALCEADAVPESAARLLIGDPAIQFRGAHPGGWQFHDLGELWQRHTGLPFVFAAWTIGSAVREAEVVSRYLHAVKERGLQARSEIAAEQEDPAFALKYLTDYIRFDLREPEREAISLFARLAARHGLIDPAGAQVRYSSSA